MHVLVRRLPNERILPFGMKENFWEMGAIGPTGPCSEIHIDHQPNSNPVDRARFVNVGRPDLTELWNIVFMEYSRYALLQWQKKELMIRNVNRF